MRRPAKRRAFPLLSPAYKMGNGVIAAERKHHNGLFNERLVEGCKTSGHTFCFFFGSGLVVSHGEAAHREGVPGVFLQMQDGIFVLALREQHGAGSAMERSLNNSVMVGIGEFFETA